MYLGIDDTDSRAGMCTTYVGLRAILKLIEMQYDIISYPRLVRLNPNIPWKTRGNGSVVIHFGVGTGEKVQIGEFNEEPIYAYKKHRKTKIDKSILNEIAKELEKYFILKDENTNPGIVLVQEKLPEWLYWRAVREIVSREDVESILSSHGAEYKMYKNGRGIIGASAGIAWRARRKTYEILTYLPEENFKHGRFVSEKSVVTMDRTFRSTFDNYDYENHYMAIMPSSNTPVLYGIRGTDIDDLEGARQMIRSSRYAGFLIYKTNQGSDDHIKRKKIAEVHGYESVLLHGYVLEDPVRIKGGHVIFKLHDRSGSIFVAAYEPTKNFRKIISKLRKGDEIEVYGGVRKEPLTVNLEKIQIISTSKVLEKISNPTCPECGRKMESIGNGKGYRCRKCGMRLPEDAARYRVIEREINGFYEVPVIARRHLARPLKLMDIK